MSFNIAIDGPAGAGKSTIARKVAQSLGFLYVDTGAMYRAIALGLIRGGIDPENPEELEKALQGMDISLQYKEGEQRILLSGEDVSSLIRTDQVSQMASVSSAKAMVREKLLLLQRNIAAAHDCVMDGRDIGTRILPGAQLKVFLTASAEVRAKRRMLQDREKGMEADYEEILKSIIERDRRDTSREVSPLRQAEDAVLVDSSAMDIEEVTEFITRLAGDRM